jgi:hypothetical protein
MAFDMKYLVNIGSNGYNSVYCYASFSGSNNGDTGGVSGFMAGQGTAAGQGFFYAARDLLRVGDIIIAGVSRGFPGGAVTTGGVSLFVVTHVSSTSTAGVTIMGYKFS